MSNDQATAASPSAGASGGMLTGALGQRPHATPVAGVTFSERLAVLHREMQESPALSGVVRLAIALYNPGSNRVSTFVNAQHGTDPVGRISVPISQLPFLHQVIADGSPVIDDVLPAAEDDGDAKASQASTLADVSHRLRQSGVQSRCSAPLYRDGVLVGFLFVNANQPGYFTPAVVAALRPFLRVAGMMLASEVDRVRTLATIVASADSLGKAILPDIAIGESAGHMARVGEYADLIARDAGWDPGLSDEAISYIHFYAPLHDIGKLAIPRGVLAKPGPLTPGERGLMKNHVLCGVAMADALQRDLGPLGVPYYSILRNIIAGHHETLDGSGYPHGLRGDAVPVESRIVAVADVFDALTSRRPYKEPWCDDAAFEFLVARAGSQFDPSCVTALLRHRDQIDGIRTRLPDGLPVSALF